MLGHFGGSVYTLSQSPPSLPVTSQHHLRICWPPILVHLLAMAVEKGVFDFLDKYFHIVISKLINTKLVVS